jgi:ParB/RepB/Spo0J family partition protein
MEIIKDEHKFTTTKIVVPIDNIKPNPWNPNKMDDFTYGKMKKTIQERGLFGSIIVREWAGIYEIIDGEHRWKACKELDYKELPIENAGEMSDQEVKFWTMYFNNTRGRDDVLKRSKLLSELDAGQTSLLPWTDEEIANERKLSEWSINEFNETKELKKEAKDLIHLTVREAVYDAWQHCLAIAKENNIEEEKMLVIMMDKFLEVFEGRAVGEKGLEI